MEDSTEFKVVRNYTIKEKQKRGERGPRCKILKKCNLQEFNKDKIYYSEI